MESRNRRERTLTDRQLSGTGRLPLSCREGKTAMKRRLGLFAASLVLASISLNAAHAAGADRLAQVHRIGVVAALGNRIQIVEFGLTALDGKNGYLPVEAWRLDDLATRDASAVLGGRFQISPVDYNAAAFLPADTDTHRADPPLKPLVQALPASGVDAYLVIRRTICCAGTGWGSDGLGAEKTKTLFGVLRPSVYVMLEVDLVEAGTGKTLISRTLGIPAAVNEVESDWADTPAKMSAAQVETLHTRIVDLVQKDVERTLTAMGLASP